MIEDITRRAFLDLVALKPAKVAAGMALAPLAAAADAMAANCLKSKGDVIPGDVEVIYFNTPQTSVDAFIPMKENVLSSPFLRGVTAVATPEYGLALFVNDSPKDYTIGSSSALLDSPVFDSLRQNTCWTGPFKYQSLESRRISLVRQQKALSFLGHSLNSREKENVPAYKKGFGHIGTLTQDETRQLIRMLNIGTGESAYLPFFIRKSQGDSTVGIMEIVNVLGSGNTIIEANQKLDNILESSVENTPSFESPGDMIIFTYNKKDFRLDWQTYKWGAAWAAVDRTLLDHAGGKGAYDELKDIMAEVDENPEMPHDFNDKQGIHTLVDFVSKLHIPKKDADLINNSTYLSSLQEEVDAAKKFGDRKHAKYVQKIIDYEIKEIRRLKTLSANRSDIFGIGVQVLGGLDTSRFLVPLIGTDYVQLKSRLNIISKDKTGGHDNWYVNARIPADHFRHLIERTDVEESYRTYGMDKACNILSKAFKDKNWQKKNDLARIGNNIFMYNIFVALQGQKVSREQNHIGGFEEFRNLGMIASPTINDAYGKMKFIYHGGKK